MARKTKSSIEKTVLTIAILNSAGETSDSIVVDASSLNKDIQGNLLMHGLKQKLQDSAAGAESPEAAQVRIAAVAKQLQDGTWVAQREGGGGAGRSTQLAKALAKMYKLEILAAEEKIAQLSDDQVSALRKNPKVKAVMAQLRAEEAAAKAKSADKADEAAEGEDVLASFG